MIEKSAFKAAWWLSSAHAQTLYSTLTRRLRSPVDHEERFELPDGDFVDLSWAVNGLREESPLVVLLHGLGGDARSKYILGLMHALNRSGWRVVLMHFRGASKEPNRLARAYHSGDTADLDCLIHDLHQREPHTKKAVVGVSLGGNVLLKWLGEKGAQTLVDAAVAISVPFQLSVVADRINQGFSRVYQAYLLRRLRNVFARKLSYQTDPSAITLRQMEAWRCFWTFDEHVTAPLHGFSHVHAYYREASSRPYLSKIQIPTLIIHALDDPFMTPDAIPTADELSEHVRLELSQKGGHVGFIGGRIPGQPIYWLDQRVPAFLSDYVASTT